MKLSLAVKIILGLFTAWAVISPFLLLAGWIFFVIIMASAGNQVQLNPNIGPAFIFPIWLILCTSFIYIGLQVFYLVHIILNKAGGDVIRIILGVGIFLFPVIAMPVYYFVYILPENPPAWALAVNSKPPEMTGSTDYPSSSSNP